MDYTTSGHPYKRARPDPLPPSTSALGDWAVTVGSQAFGGGSWGNANVAAYPVGGVGSLPWQKPSPYHHLSAPAATAYPPCQPSLASPGPADGYYGHLDSPTAPAPSAGLDEQGLIGPTTLTTSPGPSLAASVPLGGYTVSPVPQTGDWLAGDAGAAPPATAYIHATMPYSYTSVAQVPMLHQPCGFQAQPVHGLVSDGFTSPPSNPGLYPHSHPGQDAILPSYNSAQGPTRYLEAVTGTCPSAAPLPRMSQCSPPTSSVYRDDVSSPVQGPAAPWVLVKFRDDATKQGLAVDFVSDPPQPAGDASLTITDAQEASFGPVEPAKGSMGAQAASPVVRVQSKQRKRGPLNEVARLQTRKTRAKGACVSCSIQRNRVCGQASANHM